MSFANDGLGTLKKSYFGLSIRYTRKSITNFVSNYILIILTIFFIGNAFTFPKTQLEGKSLFPHVSTRNVKFEINFGKTKDGTAQEPLFPLPAGFSLAGNCLDSASRGSPRYFVKKKKNDFLSQITYDFTNFILFFQE